jgi:hypothetical protein
VKHHLQTKYRKTVVAGGKHQAQTTLLNVQSQPPAYEKAAQQSIDMPNMLTGSEPGTLYAWLELLKALPATPALIGVGLPAAWRGGGRIGAGVALS